MSNLSRLRITVRGAVQGVGFRPFVFRLATELDLRGWVNNSTQGVFIEVEGPQDRLQSFLLRLEAEKPPRSFIQSLETSWLDPAGYEKFEIRRSQSGGAKTALVLPDIATCPECLSEIFDPSNRRHFYPFTNCTHCGPRFSIIESLPYDRANTSMRAFAMCPECQAEYEEPRNRRFHAQPNACPVCGPHLELWDRQGAPVTPSQDEIVLCTKRGMSPKTSGVPLSAPSPPEEERAGERRPFLLKCVEDHGNGDKNYRALTGAAEAIRQGKVVAVKGLGGFHLMVAAHDMEAVRRLRERKHREEKPLALMFPSMESIKSVCEVSPLEERLLRSPEAPIVLLRRLDAPRTTHHTLAPGIAPNNPYLGAMLPYTPLHHLLLSLLGFPVVATSGNLSDEPICTDEHEALERLGGIADLFLVHNRPIVRHIDDSIARVMAGRELLLRRARGYAPLPIQHRASSIPHPETVLAVGAHLKNSVALSIGSQVFLSQHIGDLETDAAYEAFRRVISDFAKLYEADPSVIAADAHPDYLSTRFAREFMSSASSSLPSSSSKTAESRTKDSPDLPGRSLPRLITVQHHLAHVLSCMAENELDPPVLGIAWDGTGYGLDGTVWGGEFLLVTSTSWERVAHFRQFRLPGGDKAVKEPRRTSLGLLYAIFGDDAFGLSELAPMRAFSKAELASLKTMLARGFNSPLTSSVGRLFDAVASLVGLRQQVAFEGQAAMELEFALDGIQTDDAYSFEIAAPPKSSSSSSSSSSKGASTTKEPHSKSTLACQSPFVLDWSPVIRSILADLSRSVPVGEISAKFHNSLVESIILLARQAGQERVALSGGCYQNSYLTRRAIERLQQEGFRPYWHQRVPPNDGGIALGQVLAARRQSK